MQLLHVKYLPAICLLFVGQSVMALDSTKAIIFGVVPQHTTDRLISEWSPLINFLRHEIKRPVRFATASTIQEFEQRCANGAYDLAYMNPYHYIRYSVSAGYRVLANQSKTKLRGIIVVPETASYKSIQDLKGLTLDLPSANAFAASLLVQAELRKHNIPFRTHFSGSHDAVYRKVAMKLSHAGGGIERTFRAQPQTITSRLRILARTQGYTPHAIAAHPRVPAPLQKRIARALTRLPEHILKKLNFHPLQHAKDSDYDDIRALKILKQGIIRTTPIQQ